MIEELLSLTLTDAGSEAPFLELDQSSLPYSSEGEVTHDGICGSMHGGVDCDNYYRTAI